MKKRGLDSLLEALAEAVGQARAYFLKLDGEAVVRPGAWGPAEVLSHLVFWHRANLEGMESVLAGGQPYQPGASIEELNVGGAERNGWAACDRSAVRVGGLAESP